MGDLVITNGDAAGELLRRTLPEAEILPWRDVLHEGPVPLTPSLAELTRLRADYLARRGWGELAQLRADFAARDGGLAQSPSFDRVVLWFEHDLFDQLQLLQLLDWFASRPREDGSLLLVQASDFLGRQTPDALLGLTKTETPVSAQQLALAACAWAAFRQATPETWHALFALDLAPLPYVEPAVRRMLEELPGPDGLSRTERQMLRALAPGALTPAAVFVAVQRQEEAVFMGDWSFWGLLDGLALADEPLIEGLAAAPFEPEEAGLDQAYFQSEPSLTSFGEEVLAGGADHAAKNEIDRWWGGTHLTNDALWRYDAEAQRLIAPE